MMQQPSHPPHIPATGTPSIPPHPGAVPQYQLAPHPGVQQPASAVSTQETVAAPEPNSPNPADDPGPRRSSRKRKSPADGATEEEEERANRSPPAPAAQHEQPPHPHTTAAPQPTPEQVAAQQQAAAAAHHAQQHHQHPPPPPHHQLPPLGHPQHPQGQHLHPSFHFHPHQVPPGYVPVMPVPMGGGGVGGPPPPPPHPEPLEGNSPPTASGGRPLNTSKRAEQNRKAQRAFRERRDAHVKALESRSQLLDAALASVEEANRRWEESRQLCETLRMENAQLRAALQAYQQAGAAITQMQQIAQSHQLQQQQQPTGQPDASAASSSESTPEKDAPTEAQAASS
ncbi:hypothetical protein FRB90_011602 [Tulasnella sp. 427]|nr:hypothetical protein FRB90_011602 [Tulasnella sp. 427]